MENLGIKNMNALTSSHGLENSPRSTNGAFSMCSVNSAPKASENEYQKFDEEDLTDEIDKNGDGKITKEELKAYQEKVAKENDDIKSELDKNGDDKITKDEVGSYNPSSASSSSAPSGTTPSSSEELQDGLPSSGWTTTDEIDTEKWNVSALEELDNVPYKTNIPSPTSFDSSEDSRWIQYQIKMKNLDEATKKILHNAYMKNKEMVSCTDNLDTTMMGGILCEVGTFTRTIELSDQTKIIITANGYGESKIKIQEYEGENINDPSKDDKIYEKEFIELSDGCYALKLEKKEERFNIDGEESWAHNLVAYGDVFVDIYDKDGNLIGFNDPRRESLLQEANEKHDANQIWKA